MNRRSFFALLLAPLAAPLLKLLPRRKRHAVTALEATSEDVRRHMAEPPYWPPKYYGKLDPPLPLIVCRKVEVGAGGQFQLPVGTLLIFQQDKPPAGWELYRS